MNNNCINPYKICRENADLTQEKAGRMLHISIRSLSDYESGKTVPHEDIVLKMIDLYQAKWLGYEHLRNSSLLGQMILPDIENKEFAQAVLCLQKEKEDVNKIKSRLIEIALDNKLDDFERRDWKDISKELFELAGAALAVCYQF